PAKQNCNAKFCQPCWGGSLRVQTPMVACWVFASLANQSVVRTGICICYVTPPQPESGWPTCYLRRATLPTCLNTPHRRQPGWTETKIRCPETWPLSKRKWQRCYAVPHICQTPPAIHDPSGVVQYYRVGWLLPVAGGRTPRFLPPW